MGIPAPPPESASADGTASLAVRLRALSRRFGWRWALRGVDLEVRRGTTLALVGPNGAGKTTLLRVLATLLRPTAGEAEVLGRSVRTEGDEIRRRVGFLTAGGFLYDDLTGRENLRFATLMAGQRPRERPIAGALERVGLGDASGVRVRAYSTGMRRRLELARLLLRPVDLLLMDEPYASLDSEGIALVDRYLADFREGGGTAILASHQPGEALRTADRAALLREGRLAALGTPEALAPRLGWPVSGAGGPVPGPGPVPSGRAPARPTPDQER